MCVSMDRTDTLTDTSVVWLAATECIHWLASRFARSIIVR